MDPIIQMCESSQSFLPQLLFGKNWSLFGQRLPRTTYDLCSFAVFASDLSGTRERKQGSQDIECGRERLREGGRCMLEGCLRHIMIGRTCKLPLRSGEKFKNVLMFHCYNPFFLLKTVLEGTADLFTGCLTEFSIMKFGTKAWSCWGLIGLFWKQNINMVNDKSS